MAPKHCNRQQTHSQRETTLQITITTTEKDSTLLLTHFMFEGWVWAETHRI